ncbi:MAG: MgtC/SapB family protein [Syntrophobacteraceae bacterium]|nr:MgtC/SapB family protein [Syntrophobacteraceae bacterium]
MISDWHDTWLWVIKLSVAAVLGGAVGFERESHGQSAGLRTNVLVSVGSCLLMMLSLHMAALFSDVDATSSVRLDPGRIASYAVAGMGFLGAGAIIKGKGTVRGLTTAAGLWMVTGVGLAVGAGYLLPAIFTATISLLILYNLRHLKAFVRHDIYTVLTLTCQECEASLPCVREVLGTYRGLEVRFINYEYDMVSQTKTFRLRLCSKEDIPCGQIVERLSDRVPGLKYVAWEESDVP